PSSELRGERDWSIELISVKFLAYNARNRKHEHAAAAQVRRFRAPRIMRRAASRKNASHNTESFCRCAGKRTMIGICRAFGRVYAHLLESFSIERRRSKCHTSTQGCFGTSSKEI